MSPYDSHTTTSTVVRPTPRRTATTSVLSTSTSSSTIEPFPVLTRSQHSRLDRIISALDENAKTWAEFKDKKEELEGDTTADELDRTGQEDDREDDDIFPISLKLVFQEGTTWKEKWRGVQSRREGIVGPATNTSSSRSGLDVLRAKMDRVSLTSPEGARSSRTRRAPSAEPRNPLVQTPSLAPPPPPRPRSTPVTLSQRTPRQSTHPTPSTVKTRDFLVLKKKKEPGHSSSSDDYAGVPSLQDLALARRRRKEQEREEEGAQDSTTPPRTALQTQATAKPSRQDPIRPIPPPPVQSTPPPPSKHPLLERRLAELGLAPTSSPPFPQPTFTISNPSSPALPFSPSPRKSHIAHPSTSSASDIPALELRATRFRELHLVSTHFDAWRSIVRFQQDRSFSVDHARETWLVRCVFQDWLGVTRKLRGLRETEIEWNARESQRRERADKARKKGTWRRWREKFAVKMEERREAEVREQKEVREMELRNARSEVVKRRNEGLIRRSIKTWRLATLESLAFKFRLRYLPLHPLRRWRQALTIKTSHVEMLESVAEEVWVGSEQKRLGRVFSDWRKKMRLKIAKDAVEGRLEEGIKRGVLSVWVDKTRSALHIRQLENLAAESDARRIASSAFRTWSSRHSQVVALSESADDLAATFSVRLAQRSIKTWSLSTDAARFHQSRTDSIAKEFLSKWVEKLDHLQIDLEGKALEVIKEKNTQLLAVSFGEWKTSNRHRQRLLQAAEGVSRAKSLTRSIRGWREKLRGNELQVRKGEVVREFFVQRSAWRKWVDRVEEKKRERWVEGRIRLRKKEALAFWIARTRQAKDDKVLVAIVQEKSRKRIFQERLATWKDQVIVRKELERESTILYESRLAESALKRWVNVTVSVGNQLARADEFRAIKAEDSDGLAGLPSESAQPNALKLETLDSLDRACFPGDSSRFVHINPLHRATLVAQNFLPQGVSQYERPAQCASVDSFADLENFAVVFVPPPCLVSFFSDNP
ncbi:hypothetical protein JCM16303_003919 [Sporobolomyces ruberrimus]